mgnify:CR=1 FL=1
MYIICETAITDGELKLALIKSLEGRSPKKVLILPPDFTRMHSGAGKITAIYYELLKDRCIVDVMPALGTHTPMTREECKAFFLGKVPYEKLIVDNDAGSKGNWGTTQKGVKITGVWGYALTPPADVKQACKIQAMRWFMRAKQGYQDAGVNANLGEMIYAQELDPDVKMLLAPYRLHNAVTGW